MYIEKNGYLVVNPTELSFLTEDRDFSDNLEMAEIFSSNTSALEAINQFVEGDRYIVLRYNNTIWIDEDAEQPRKKEEKCECEKCGKSDCVKINGSDDIKTTVDAIEQLIQGHKIS